MAEVLNTKQVAEEMGIPEPSVRRMIRNEELSAVKVGRGYGVTRDELNRYLGRKPEKPRVNPYQDEIDKAERDAKIAEFNAVEAEAKRRIRLAKSDIETIDKAEKVLKDWAKQQEGLANRAVELEEREQNLKAREDEIYGLEGREALVDVKEEKLERKEKKLERRARRIRVKEEELSSRHAEIDNLINKIQGGLANAEGMGKNT